MWKIIKENYIMLGLFGISLLTIYIGVITPPNMLKCGWYDKCGLCIVGGLFILVIGIGISSKIYDKIIDNKKTNLIQKGIRGEAEILDMKRVGYSNKLPKVKLLLQITLSDRPPYQIKHNETVSYFQLNSMHIGATLSVYVDPNNSKKVLIEYS